MQLKFKRYANTKKGLLGSSTTFCLEALLQVSPEEDERITESKRWGSRISVLCSSPDGRDDHEFDQAIQRYCIGDVRQGVVFAFDDFNHVFIMEAAIMEASQQLLSTVNALASFDNTERVIDVTETSRTLVAAG